MNERHSKVPFCCWNLCLLMDPRRWFEKCRRLKTFFQTKKMKNQNEISILFFKIVLYIFVFLKLTPRCVEARSSL